MSAKVKPTLQTFVEIGILVVSTVRQSGVRKFGLCGTKFQNIFRAMQQLIFRGCEQRSEL